MGGWTYGGGSAAGAGSVIADRGRDVAGAGSNGADSGSDAEASVRKSRSLHS